MNLDRLAACQKRILAWQDFLETHEISNSVRLKTLDTIKEYRNLLVRCWEQNRITDEDVNHLNDLERRLEGLNEDARLRTM